MRTAVFVVGALYLALVVAVFAFQRSLLYFPSHNDVPPKGGASFVPWLDDKGEFLGYVLQRGAPRRVAIIFHGNAGEALDRTWFVNFFPNKDTTVVLAEHPGFGARNGELTEGSLVAAGRQAVAVAKARWGVPITLMGESLGTGVAAAAAADPLVERLALISPYNSVAEVGAGHYPFLPVRLLIKDSFKSYEYLKDVKVPLHIIHGDADDIIPLSSAKALFDSYAGPKTFTKLPGHGHNDMAEGILALPEGAPFRAFVLSE